MNTRKELGKIRSIHFGHGGYQDAMIGVSFDLGSDGWGVGDFWGNWAPSLIDYSEHCKWTEEQRSSDFADLVRRIDALLAKAKKRHLADLVDVPIEVEFDGTTLKSWRVLTEVI